MEITITATADSVFQAKKLLKAGVDVLYIVESTFGLRLANSFTRKELKEIVSLAHLVQAKVIVAVNALMHPDKIKNVLEYLRFLEEILADQIMVSDPGVIWLLQKERIKLPYIYEASAFVTSARQVNFFSPAKALVADVLNNVLSS